MKCKLFIRHIWFILVQTVSSMFLQSLIGSIRIQWLFNLNLFILLVMKLIIWISIFLLLLAMKELGVFRIHMLVGGSKSLSHLPVLRKNVFRMMKILKILFLLFMEAPLMNTLKSINPLLRRQILKKNLVFSRLLICSFFSFQLMVNLFEYIVVWVFMSFFEESLMSG